MRTDVVCVDERARRAALHGHPSENGIDFLEVDASDLRLVKRDTQPGVRNPRDPEVLVEGILGAVG